MSDGKISSSFGNSTLLTPAYACYVAVYVSTAHFYITIHSVHGFSLLGN